ncbi:DUF1592 domain-containing protein [Planctomycetes bacterium K23_9]|uniref:Planctomycete cytochrome C n=1 Tax=Stieleria marina TaxID=1930275 RepID=A0A517NYF8_9BACT|nr:Planctomycete cytochrome C [Planctomycetes bacterium K23_9]
MSNLKRMVVITLACVIYQCVTADAATPVVDAPAFRSTVQPFFKKHCNACHDADVAEGDLRLDNLAADFSARESSGHWVEVLDRINLDEMPPEGEPRPTENELADVTEWISNNLSQMRRSIQSTGGRVVMRRLSRSEYANTVRDLLNVEFVDGEGPLEDLPPDGSIQGFDRLSRALLVDPSLMQAYIDVGGAVADRAIVFRPPAIPTKTLHFDFVDTRDSAMSYLLQRRAILIDDPFLTVMQSGARTFGKLRHPSTNTEIPVTGRYRIRVRAAADPGKTNAPVFMDLTFGSLGRLARFRVDADRNDPQIYEHEQTFDAAIPGEFGVSIVNGTRFNETTQVVAKAFRDANQLFDDGKPMESLRAKARMRAEGVYGTNMRSGYRPNVIDTKPLPKLHLQWIEVTGPLQPDFPPPSMQAIFPDGIPAVSQRTLETATKAFARLLPRAFRRPTTKAELDAIIGLVKMDLVSGASFQQAMQTGITAMLCSPNFLYLREDASSRPRKLTDMETATRLSYLLWSSKPDDELFRAAASGRLTQTPAEIDRQIDRMLADVRSEGFVDGFARQWLKVDEFNRFQPDDKIFPKFYETEFAGLDQDIVQEPLAFFREVLHNDESLRSFLSSGWLMLNERLATYYDINKVAGNHFRRVPLVKADAWMEQAKLRLRNEPGIGPIHMVGPFTGTSPHSVFDKRYPPEEKVSLDDSIDQLPWKGLRWTQHSDWHDGKIHQVFAKENSAYYLYRKIESKIAQDLTLALGSDDAIKVWVNGDRVLSNYAIRAIEPNQERVTVSLRVGKNDVLIKIVNGDSDGGFYFQAETIAPEIMAALNVAGPQRSQDQRQLLEDTYLAESASAARGGLLGMAGVHLWGADGSRTKPVERGKYLLTVLFNDPPPPPPPNAGEVEPNLNGKQLSVRERLELHREQTTCNHCHRRIDPYGLALENFNAIGQWRVQTDGEKPVNQYWGERAAIDPSGVLPNGTEFRNFLEFKRAILKQERRFYRGFTEKLMMYALGRTIEPTDRPTIDRILSAASKEGMTIRALLTHIAKSEPFLTK